MKSPVRVFLIWAFVASVVLGAQSRLVPAPDATFGFKPGADFKLATYDQSIDYFRKLAAASKYVRLVEAGKTSLGRTMYFALISTPKNLDQIERYRQIAQRLAHPAGLTDASARELAREGKPIIHIDGGLHSTEVAGAQHTPLLAYDLVSRAQAEDPAAKAILDNVILMLWPTINPDGQQMVSEWYMSNVGTPYELSGLPQLYQEYVGHDNNRDAYMLNMIESRVIEQAWRDWEPNIVYVHHQSSPFPTRIWLPPFSEPIGSDAPFLMSREVNMIGMAIAKGLEERGQVGATHMGTAFDAWYPGYIDYAPNFKNVPAFWTETALFQYATPREYTIADFPESFRDLRPQSLYPSPWRPGWWRLGDAVAYMQTASLAVLEYASKYKESLLYNRYMAGRDQIARGRSEAPFAYFVPQEQRDPVAAVELLRRLAFGGVRVSQLTAATTVAGETFPAGTWVVPTDQEFAAMARQVLNVQKYPDMRQYPGGPPMRPYDAAGWTLPLQMGVRVVAATTPLTDDVRANLKLLGPAPDPRRKPMPYVTDRRARRRPLRQRARHRLRLESQRRGHRAAGRARDRCRVQRWRSTRRRTTRFAPSTAPGRTPARACRSPPASPACAMSSPASPRRRRTSSSRRWRSSPSARRRAARRWRARGSVCSGPGARAWTKAGPGGSSSSTASISSRCGRQISARRCGRKSTSSSWLKTRGFRSKAAVVAEVAARVPVAVVVDAACGRSTPTSSAPKTSRASTSSCGPAGPSCASATPARLRSTSSSCQSRT